MAGQAALSSDAGVGYSIATSWVAATGLTSVASWASRSRLTVERVPHASLLGSWSSHKSIGTGALGGSIDDTTQGVGATDSFTLARIFAAMVQTGLVDGTVGVGAAAGLTVASDASLAVGTLFLTQTRQLAHAGHTALTLGTILGVSAHCFALAAHARTSRRTIAI